MIKKLLTALALTLATPAVAQVGPYVEANAASTFENKNLDYGITLGGAIPVKPMLNLLVEGTAENFAEGSGSTKLVGSLGLGTNLPGPFDLFGKVGYINQDGDSGYRLGAGVNVALTSHTYASVGVRRDDIDGDSDLSGTVGLGLRF
jgi:hypothetical protein